MAYVRVEPCMLLCVASVLSRACGMPAQPDRPGHGLHNFMTDRHRYDFFGTLELNDDDHPYHTANPSEVTSDGDHVTFDLRQAGHRRRQRRSESPHSDTVHFKVRAFDSDYRLAVTESRAMFGDHSVVELVGANGNVTGRRPMLEPTHCYYRGRVSGSNGSLVALSTCNGMRGAVLSRRDAFYVDPLPPYLLGHAANTHGHTHIVYRRSTDRAAQAQAPDTVEHCGVGERDDPSTYKRNDFNYIPYHAAKDEIMAKFNPQRLNVFNQFGTLHLEMAIVVDTYMYEHHDRDVNALKTYIFTLINMMQAVLNPSGVGFDVKIHLTRIVFLIDHQPTLPISHDSIKLLASFSDYQRSINPMSDRHVMHHDYALLLSGYDLCAGDDREGCGELGRAYIASLCSPKTSCGVTRDRGIQNAIVMAHELGHGLGARHDRLVCKQHGGYVMESSVTNTKQYWEFSDCSKAFFRDFLSQDTTECVLDCPLHFHGLVSGSTVLPGEVYDENQQCAFQFPNYTACHSRLATNLCERLYCDSGDPTVGCWTTFQAALDGTPCGRGKMCYHRKCVDNNTVDRKRLPKYSPCQNLPGNQNIRDRQREPFIHFIRTERRVDGEWSAWSDWSGCTLTCGGGFSHRFRLCNNPSPANGGADCNGVHVDIEPCKTPPCAALRGFDNTAVGDPKVICARMSGGGERRPRLVPFSPRNATASTACHVFCAGLDDPAATWRDVHVALPDGAECKRPVAGGFVDGRCAGGICGSDFGCDGIINSGLTRDICNTCGGTGQCCTFKHEHTQPIARSRRGLHHLLDIPRGANNVLVRQKSQSKLFVLSLRSEGERLLNGRDGTIDPSVRRAIPPRNTSILTYSRPKNAADTITVQGALRSRLLVYSFKLIGAGSNVDPGVDATYSLPLTACSADYFWGYDSPPCSVTCGDGRRTVRWRCRRRSDGQSVSDRECRRYRIGGREQQRTVRCSAAAPCATSASHQWLFYSWGDCSKTCGGGEQRRRVSCFTAESSRPVNASFCAGQSEPSSVRQCNHFMCAERGPRWLNKKWSPCSASCGEGIQVRVVMCRQYINGQPFNMPPYVCQKKGVKPELPTYRKCTSKTPCQDTRRPRDCTDISPLCKILKTSRGCSDPGMKDLCCNTCVR